MLKTSFVKNVLKRVLFASNFTKVLHLAKNKNRLTVVMFHRVLSETDARWAGCDMTWTVSKEIFESCIVFFKKNYSVINLDDLEHSLENEEPLPSYPLLITFDDGWADNAEYALPILLKYQVSAVVFLVTQAIGQAEPLNEEFLYHAWKTGQSVILKKFFPASDEKKGKNTPINYIQKFRLLPSEEKQKVISELKKRVILPPQNAMLSKRQVKELVTNGVKLGSHGVSHEPMTSSQHLDLVNELSQSRTAVLDIIRNDASQADCTAFSFPHGCYNHELLQEAYRTGYKFVFTSDPYLTLLNNSRAPAMTPLSRISIPSTEITDKNGRFSETQLAFWLMNRKAR